MAWTSTKWDVVLIQLVKEFLIESALNVRQFQIIDLFSKLLAAIKYLYTRIYKADNIQTLLLISQICCNVPHFKRGIT